VDISAAKVIIMTIIYHKQARDSNIIQVVYGMAHSKNAFLCLPQAGWNTIWHTVDFIQGNYHKQHGTGRVDSTK